MAHKESCHDDHHDGHNDNQHDGQRDDRHDAPHDGHHGDHHDAFPYHDHLLQRQELFFSFRMYSLDS